MVIAQAPGRDQAQALRKLVKNLACMVPQEHLATAPLPSEMVHIINIADEVRLLESDDMAILIREHS